jgi:hypothetical protein
MGFVYLAIIRYVFHINAAQKKSRFINFDFPKKKNYCRSVVKSTRIRAVSATVATVGLDWRRREPTVSAKDSSFSTANSNDTDLSSVHLFKAGSSSKKNLEATRAGEAEGRYTLTSERET